MDKKLMDQLLYPESKPFNTGTLQADNHTLKYEEFGNPEGVPIVYLHGGPGAGCGPHFHRFFDPGHFRIVIYDQRGAPTSTPQAELRNNSPDLLVEDNERLRKHLGIDKWHVYGGSWGSTLALLYAEKYPEPTLSLTLRGIFLMREKEIDWFINKMGTMFPENQKEFVEFLPEKERGDLLESYYQRLVHPDPAIHLPAARAWTWLENGCAYREIPADADRESPPHQVLGFARIEAHFFRNHKLHNRILDDITQISHIPTMIVQGRHDVVCPPESAFDLAQEMKNCSLLMTQAGHSASEPETMKALVAATNRIRDTGSPMLPKKAVAPSKKPFGP